MRFVLLILTSGLLTLVHAGQESPSPGNTEEGNMSAEDRAKAIKLLFDSQKQLIDSIENLSEAQWAYKPSPFRWSVREVAEHILLSEGLLFEAMQKALAAKPNPEWKAATKDKTELLERVMINRLGKAQAPERIQPSGKMTREEILKRFKEVRAATRKFVEQTNLPLKAHTLDHPFPVFSTLSAYQWLLYIPLHNIRHNQQIAEVKSSPGFPK